MTAGNASGVNDGAGALVLASEAAAARTRAPPSPGILGFAQAAIPPPVVGAGASHPEAAGQDQGEAG
ncbi:MAG: hypothetical protein IPP58_15080 [Holophagaceae bacterium]|uniref:Uncharacterized protein n=1 Tax=Candidatus Geothrix skivensis TaxID=2954439 RepID=A0A9D7XMP9_9BACT|nr:hypothetical protein [Candidatus Geothrix skivensis]